MPTYNAQIYSPRWGHNDTYSFAFAEDSLTIEFAPRVAKCTWRDNQDPTWTGERFDQMLRNDSIYAPEILTSLIEHLWKAWRNGDIAGEAVDAELQEVIAWLNQVTAAKPKSEFWRKYF